MFDLNLFYYYAAVLYLAYNFHTSKTAGSYRCALSSVITLQLQIAVELEHGHQNGLLLRI